MKKLVSLLSAAAMLAMLAVPASAALTYAPDEDGWYVISEAPTDAEVAEYAPTLETSAVLLKSEDDLKAISSAVNKKFKSKLATHDIYKVTYDMANIGTFVNAYDEDYNNAFFGLYDITVSFDAKTLPEGYETYALTYTLPDGSTGAVGVGTDLGTGYLQAAYTAAGVAYDTIFPARTNDEGIVVDAGTYKAEYIIAFPKQESTITLPMTNATMITYKTTVGAANSVPATSNIAPVELKFVKEEPKPEITIGGIIEANGKLENGKDIIGRAWDVTIENYQAGTYVPTFTDVDTEEKHVAAAIGFTGAEADGSTVNFVTLLRLSAERNVALAIDYMK